MTAVRLSEGIYTRSLPVFYWGDGDLNYRFYASDGLDNATGTPTFDSIVTVTNNNIPVGGYTVENVIPAAQVTQSGNGDGIITINWKGRDVDSNYVTLKTFEYSVDGGSNWNAPTNGDSSASLGANWIDNGGGGYSTSSSFAGADAHSFTFDTDHDDVSGMAGIDQNDVQVRFTLHDSDDSASPVTSESFQVDNVAPTDTITSADYDADNDTMTITGTNFTTIASVGTDINAYVDWTKFVWDIDDNDSPGTGDITFAVSDVTSLTVTDDTTLTLVLTTEKGNEIEGTTGYGPSPDDTLDVSTGFSKNAIGNAATSDGNSNVDISFN
jgi:hypothetical protein